MKFQPTPIQGVVHITLDCMHDERGLFARSYCEKEFAAHGIHDHFVQQNISFNAKKHTLRGMHYQTLDAPESKIVSVVRGAIYDVVLDIRPDSPTYKQYFSAELSADNRERLYIPPGVAHGFLTLEDDSEVHYQMGGYFVPAAQRGIRYNDPAISIAWPHPPAVISEKDQHYPDTHL